jgi:hypothetical protein
MMEALRTSETSVNNHFTWQYIPKDNSEHHTRRRENLKSHVFRIVFWDVLPCKIIVDRRFRGTMMMEAVCNSETSFDNYFTWQYIPEDNSEQKL